METRLPLSGSLSEFDVATLLGSMSQQALDGQLKISSADFVKVLQLENGCIIFAQSTLKEDSLGRFLLRRQVIDAVGFEKSAAYMQEKNIRHGRALLELGLLNPEQLWSEVHAHLRAIVFSLFPMSLGQYSIDACPPSDSENIVLNVPVPEAILEGIRQIQDPAFIENKFQPDMLAYRAAAANHPRLELKPYELHVLSLVGAGTPLREIVAKSELLRIDTLKVLYALSKLGLVCDRRQPSRQPLPQAGRHVSTTFVSFDEILQYYNGKFEYIYRILSKEIGPVAQTILFDAITSILESIPTCFQNLQVTANGRIEEKSILKSIWYENFDENSGEFLKGLEEILYAEIYAVKRHLGKDHEKLILQWIRESGD